MGRYVVVVDDDIDITNMDDVLWAMTTRVDPARDIEIISGAYASAGNGGIRQALPFTGDAERTPAELWHGRHGQL